MNVCTWSEYIKNPSIYSEIEVRQVLQHLPPDVLGHITSKIVPLIATQKIQAIKGMREYTNMGLRDAKNLIDLMTTGVALDSCRYSQPALIDTIEVVENYLREAIRKSTYDEKAMSALVGIKQQVSDLWMELVELPPQP